MIDSVGERETMTQPRVIAFFRSDDIEAWGRGIQRVFQACRKAGTPEPHIEFDGRDVWVEFPFSEAYLKLVREEPDEATDRTTQETTQETILALLRKEPTLTRRALSERIGITPDGIKYHLDKLRDAGRIRHVGPTKKGRWEVREQHDE